jgi:hypothetical protein
LTEQIIDQIRRAQLEIASSLAAGNASSFEAYKELAGRFAGLEQAHSIINDLLRMQDHDDNR